MSRLKEAKQRTVAAIRQQSVMHRAEEYFVRNIWPKILIQADAGKSTLEVDVLTQDVVTYIRDVERFEVKSTADPKDNPPGRIVGHTISWATKPEARPAER